MREIDLNELNHTFHVRPLLIGGMAMEYYGLRQAGDDIDFVIVQEDYDLLASQYPDNIKDLFGDKGICVGKFELWTTICLFDYAYLSDGAIEKENYSIISLEKLLFLKALAMKEAKYEADLRLVVEKILNIKYGADNLPD